jgi:hypothetical protein
MLIEKLTIPEQLYELLHKEINEARQQENHAETIISTNYWRGYREGLERVLGMLLRLNKGVMK